MFKYIWTYLSEIPVEKVSEAPHRPQSRKRTPTLSAERLSRNIKTVLCISLDSNKKHESKYYFIYHTKAECVSAVHFSIRIYM